MPELPEVETTRKGISAFVTGKIIKNVIIRNDKLRWPIPYEIIKHLKNNQIVKLKRRAKYLLFETRNGCLIIHLGMSGSLRITEFNQPFMKHDHVDFVFEEYILRYNDPRRFGCILWTNQDPLTHKLISHLGPEPLSNEFNYDYLYKMSRKRSCSIKALIMNHCIVVGIGNIYANEALFLSKINPKHKASKISKLRYEKLVFSMKTILSKAIKKGGTTIRDFVNSDGKPGYFSNELKVYNRSGQSCDVCKTKIKKIKQNQRSTFYCTSCQT